MCVEGGVGQGEDTACQGWDRRQRAGEKKRKEDEDGGDTRPQTASQKELLVEGLPALVDMHCRGRARGSETVTFSQTHRGINREHLGPGWTGQLLFAGSTLA